MKILFIVESPAKAKTIKNILESVDPTNSYNVKASFGHVRDLEPKTLSIDIENNFKPAYVPLEKKKDILNDLKTSAKNVDTVYLASDCDREGESIAWHLKDCLGLQNYKRITFTEITKQGIEQAIKNPRDIDINLVDAQQTRRMIDRIVGFKLSPVLWRNFKANTTLSAGRVQSAALKLIVDQEFKINAHIYKTWWEMKGLFVCNSILFENCTLYENKNIKQYENIEECKEFFKSLKNEFKIQKTSSKIVNESPQPPYITSTLQQDAYNKFGLAANVTMKLAQELYENGYITYMRTDSTNICKEAINACKSLIVSKFGNNYYEGSTSLKKIKHAQEAHEAIRPTNVIDSPQLTGRQAQLYDMIWKRTIASQMKDCLYSELNILIIDKSIEETTMSFLGTKSVMIFDGYKKVYEAKTAITKPFWDSENLNEIYNWTVTCKSISAANQWNSPPSRFNESTLVKMLEHEGIGKPSTFAGILEKLQEKSYVSKQNINGVSKPCNDLIWDATKVVKNIETKNKEIVLGAETNKLVPSEIGTSITTFLSNDFADIVDKTFTAKVETSLDDIAKGDQKSLDVMQSFWNVLRPRIEASMIASKKSSKKEINSEENTISNDIIIRIAKFGPVIQVTAEGTTNKRYIDLKPFLEIFKKDYTNVSETEAQFLVRLPLKVTEGELMYGQFGFYIKRRNGTSLTIPNTWIVNNITDISILANLSKDQLDAIVAINENKVKTKSKFRNINRDKSKYNKKTK